MYVNELNVSIFGIRRGGQHAIINWLASHYAKEGDPVWFFNDIRDYGKPIPIRCDTGAVDAGIFVRNPTAIPQFWKQPKRVMFQTYEDLWFGNLNIEANEKRVGRSRQRLYIYILRDPYNTFASRLCHSGPVFQCDYGKIELWKNFAREAVGQTTVLPGAVFVNYNRWVREPEYRRELEAELGLHEDDEWVDRVTGVGSTFTKQKMDGKATEMKLFERWKFVRNSPFFETLLRDRTVQELSDQLFGPIVDKKDFVKARAKSRR